MTPSTRAWSVNPMDLGRSTPASDGGRPSSDLVGFRFCTNFLITAKMLDLIKAEPWAMEVERTSSDEWRALRLLVRLNDVPAEYKLNDLVDYMHRKMIGR